MQLGLIGKFPGSSVYTGICELDVFLFILHEMLYLVNIFMGLGFAYSERPIRWWWFHFLYSMLVVRTLSQDPGCLPSISFSCGRVKTCVSHSLEEYSCLSYLKHVLNCLAVGVFLCFLIETVLQSIIKDQCNEQDQKENISLLLLGLWRWTGGASAMIRLSLLCLFT